MQAIPNGWFSWDFTVIDHGKPVADIGVIGSTQIRGLFSRRIQVDLPRELALAKRVFIVWLAVILWKRDADAAAAGT